MSTNTENKLNTSLDDILKTERAGRRGRGGRRSNAGRRSTGAAPVGGVSKPTKQTKQPVKTTAAVPTGPAGGDHKIMISNLVSLSSPAVFDRTTLTRWPASRCR